MEVWYQWQPDPVKWWSAWGSLLTPSTWFLAVSLLLAFGMWQNLWLVNGCSAHFDVLPSINWILGDGHHSIHSGLTYQLWWIPFMMVGWPIYRILTYINHETWPWHVEVPVNIHIFFFSMVPSSAQERHAEADAAHSCWGPGEVPKVLGKLPGRQAKQVPATWLLLELTWTWGIYHQVMAISLRKYGTIMIYLDFACHIISGQIRLRWVKDG